MNIISSPPMLPTVGSFSGHETFAFRYAWLKKGLDGWRQRPDIFAADEAMAILGVGKNMVRSIRHWCLATGLMEDDGGRRGGVQPTDMGRFLITEADPYLENDGSLWLLHWRLVTSMQRATTWYWAFNLNKDPEWSRESLQDGLTRWVMSRGKNQPSSTSLKSDVSCFVRTYVSMQRGPASTPEETLDCPLTTLGLIVEVQSEKGEGKQRYRFNSRPKPSLPPAIFIYALLDFWQSRHSEAKTLSLRQITHDEASPGRVFRLDDDAVLDYLDRLGDLTEGKLMFHDTANIRQVSHRMAIAGEEILRAFYQVN